MSEETIVAVYDTAAHAQAAATDLRSLGVPESAISLHGGSSTTASSTTTATGTTATGTTATGTGREPGFWSSLFGGEPEYDSTVYDRSMASGSTVLTVKTPGEHVTRVMEILEGHHPIDIDERAAGYGLTQSATTGVTTGAMASTATTAPLMDTGVNTANRATGDSIQLAEESLTIGKRVVNSGGTRIRRYVVERPVEEQVTLHDEKVTLERRPVTDGRPATDSFSERTIEMTASAEEAVVAKTARVVEEVGLRKEAVERVETVRDTVRKEEVDVEQIPGTMTTGTTTTTGTTGTTGTTKI